MFARTRFEHRFPPNSGRTVGYLGLALGAGVIALSILYMPLRQWATLSLGTLAACIALWAILLRPRAFATGQDLVLWNMVSDTWIPLAAVELVEPKHALIVWAHGKKHHCVGIAKSRRVARAALRNRVRDGEGTIARRAGWEKPQGGTERIVYEDFVATRIEELARNARDQGLQPGPVRRVPAVLEIALLTVSVAAFAVAFFL